MRGSLPCPAGCACSKHDERVQRIEKVCPTCLKTFLLLPSRSYKIFCSASCVTHKPNSANMPGALSPSWKGGRTHDNDRATVYVAPGKYELEHRLIAAKTLGRQLERGEFVHHIDGDCRNNAPENLQVMSPSEHSKLHAAERARKGEYPRQGADITGQTFDRLTVLQRGENGVGWKCLCSCGNIRITSGYNLRAGLVKSCGCLQKPCPVGCSCKRHTNRKVKKICPTCSTEFLDYPSGKLKYCSNGCYKR